MYIDKDMTLQRQLEYVYREVLLDTQWVEAELNDGASIAVLCHSISIRVLSILQSDCY